MPLGMGPGLLGMRSKGGSPFTIYPHIVWMVTMCIFYLPKTSIRVVLLHQRETERERKREKRESQWFLWHSFPFVLFTEWPQPMDSTATYVNGPKLDYLVELINATLIYLTIPWTQKSHRHPNSARPNLQSCSSTYGLSKVLQPSSRDAYSVALPSVRRGTAPSQAFYPLSQTSPSPIWLPWSP